MEYVNELAEIGKSQENEVVTVNQPCLKDTCNKMNVSDVISKIEEKRRNLCEISQTKFDTNRMKVLLYSKEIILSFDSQKR